MRRRDLYFSPVSPRPKEKQSREVTSCRNIAAEPTRPDQRLSVVGGATATTELFELLLPPRSSPAVVNRHTRPDERIAPTGTTPQSAKRWFYNRKASRISAQPKRTRHNLRMCSLAATTPTSVSEDESNSRSCIRGMRHIISL
jgi:hypothetical protein